MLECKVVFFKNIHHSDPETNGSHEETPPKEEAVPCFISIHGHQLSFFKNKNDSHPLYEYSVTYVSAQLEKDKQSLLLSKKWKKVPLVRISSSSTVLEKLLKFCSDNSDETRLWNPLYFTPCDKARESYLNTNKFKHNFTGLANLALVATVFAKFKDVITNYLNNGILAPKIVVIPTVPEMLFGLVGCAFNSFFMYGLEKLAFKRIIPSSLANFLHTVNLLLAFLFPILFSISFHPNPLFALACVFWCIMMAMKMISYVHVMNEVRNIIPKVLENGAKNGKDHKTTQDKEELHITNENMEIIRKHSKNPSSIISVKDILYFYFAPTLTYQLWYPRTPGIRWGWLVRNSTKLLLCLGVFLFWLNQYVVPIMESAGLIFRDGSFLEKLGLVIDLANAYLICCLLFFYVIFHLFTNVLAEILTFADREFYKDWWNSRGLGHFWSLWNLPVHKWMTRHLYYPILKKGYSRRTATLAVFFVSGIAHEYLYCVPLRVLTIFSIVMMFGMAPMLVVERRYNSFFRRSQTGNILFWCIFWFICNPIGILFYYSKYLVEHGWVI